MKNSHKAGFHLLSVVRIACPFLLVALREPPKAPQFLLFSHRRGLCWKVFKSVGTVHKRQRAE